MGIWHCKWHNSTQLIIYVEIILQDTPKDFQMIKDICQIFLLYINLCKKVVFTHNFSLSNRKTLDFPPHIGLEFQFVFLFKNSKKVMEMVTRDRLYA